MKALPTMRNKGTQWGRYAASGGLFLFILYISLPLFHLAVFNPVWTQPWYFGGSGLTLSFIKQLDDPAVTSILWSPDGKYLLLISDFNRKITVYDTEDWHVVTSIMRQRTSGDENSFLQFFPGTDLVVMPSIGVSDQNRTYLQTLDIRKDVVNQSFDVSFTDDILDDNITPQFPDAVAISGNGKVLADSVDSEIHVFDGNTSKIIRVFRCGRYTTPGALALSGNGDVIITGDCHPNMVSFFDVKSGSLNYEVSVGRKPAEFNYITYSPDRNEVAIGSSDSQSGIVTVLQASNGHILEEFPSEPARISNLQWIDNNKILTSYDYSRPGGSITRIWDKSSGRCVQEFGANNLYVASVDYQKDRIAISTGEAVTIERFKQ